MLPTLEAVKLMVELMQMNPVSQPLPLTPQLLPLH